MNPTIQTRELVKRYGKTSVLGGIDLTVPEGAIYALVGANGAGKTTMIKLLMNILRPTSGSARVLDVECERLAGKAFERIAYVSENQELPDTMTVTQMLEYLRGFYPRWDVGLEQALVRQFDLPMDRKMKHLSRGMKMKAAFAGSLCYRPELIVLDEPFTGLDPLVRDELIESLLERSPEATIFLSSHDLAEIESFASHVGYLEEGRMLFSEEMAVLSERFREVTVTLETPMKLPHNLPGAWLQAETADCVVRFVDSEFRGDASEREVAERFIGVRDVSCEAMPLRSIFLAIAKTGRTQSHAAQTTVGDGKVGA